MDDDRHDSNRTHIEDEGTTLDPPEGVRGFVPGQVLGERYRVLELLGRSGMGGVWRAFDPKLRVELALKALRDDLLKCERRLELLRQEVRAARDEASSTGWKAGWTIEIGPSPGRATVPEW